MKKTFLKKLLIAFSAACLIVYGTIYACSDYGDWGWSFDSNFTPETFVDKSYSPLFLSTDIFYGIGFDTDHITRFNSEIIEDWSTYLDAKINKKDLTFFLTDSSSVVVTDLDKFYKNGKANQSSEKWGKQFKLNDTKIKDFILFLHDAQTIEAYSTQPNDSWDYNENIKPEVVTNINWIKTVEKKYNDTEDPFLKNRYWFLVIKAYFYSNSQINAVNFFNQIEASTPKNTLYYRALAYLAGIEYKQKNYAKSNYLYSQVFDKCPAMRGVAAYCFHPQEQKDWEQSLNMAKTTDEKTALWAVQGYYADEEKAIAEIYKLQPKNQHLDYLLTRLINKQENKISNFFNDKTIAENQKTTKDSIRKSTIDLVTKIAQSDKTLQPYLWKIATGYLETLRGNFKQADKYFDKAQNKMPKTPIAVSQVRLLRFVNNLSKINHLNAQNEKTILADLNWLYFELPKNEIENFRYQKAILWSKNYLAALYKEQKNTVMSEIFNPDLKFYDNEKDLLDMKAFLSKANQSGLEKIGTAIYEIKLTDINYFEGVKATFQNKIPEAIVFMKQSDNLQSTVFLGNPFLGNIKDCHDCDHLESQKKKYTIIDFLTIVKKMQDNVTQQVDVYNNSLLLGNAFYNITHFGNSRIFYEEKIAGYGSSPDYFRDPIREMITNCTLAKAYYEKAFAAAKNNEQKAKCQYMIAKCERNDYYSKKYYSKNLSGWDYQDDNTNFIAWQGFKNLKANYSKTKYYQEIINECGYFKTYARK